MTPGALLTRTTQWLKRHELRVSKSLGQHFLIDEEVLNRIIEHSHLSENDLILEIGTGTGVLTQALAEHVKLVYTIEKDSNFFQALSEELGTNTRIQLIYGDATQIEWPRTNKLVANLPYTISSPVLFRLFESETPSAVVMLQKEFGERLIAQARSKQYGRLTVMTAYYAAVELLEVVEPESFYPPPAVSSTLVRIIRHTQPPFEVNDVKLFGQVVIALFNQRRKKIRTPLKMFLGNQQFQTIQAEIPWLDQRVEELSPEQIAEISNIIYEDRGV